MVKFTLKSARVTAGFTLKEASKELGIHYQTLSKYENDSEDIPNSLFHKIAQLYGIPEDQIFLGNNIELIRYKKTLRNRQPLNN